MISLLDSPAARTAILGAVTGLALASLPACGTRSLPPAASESDPYLAARQAMVEQGVVAWGIEDPAVIEAMSVVPRHEFVPQEFLDQAYENHPLPIGLGQTISQPYIVALMSEQADIQPEDNVLEIGTGSGYQAAILSHLSSRVYTIEILEELAASAAERFSRLGYGSIHTRHADGFGGWPEQAPFDAILVTAAPDHVPPPLLEQLAVGGVMVVPIGPVGGYQELWRIERLEDGQIRATSLGGVRFVPLLRAQELGS
ncbi:MAG: protein-L-isoaspartate(D-aspartate) O-methyltransferase [Anaerolineales bacterium]|nr:protein-L-isoaspartate(D-aspartate) O-methyltransferase [Anaerolineales bacterium]